MIAVFSKLSVTVISSAGVSCGECSTATRIYVPIGII